MKRQNDAIWRLKPVDIGEPTNAAEDHNLLAENFGVETAKPIWVREHSCPAYGFETDRDANAVVRRSLTGSKRVAFATTMNILQRGFSDLGLE